MLGAVALLGNAANCMLGGAALLGNAANCMLGAVALLGNAANCMLGADAGRGGSVGTCREGAAVRAKERRCESEGGDMGLDRNLPSPAALKSANRAPEPLHWRRGLLETCTDPIAGSWGPPARPCSQNFAVGSRKRPLQWQAPERPWEGGPVAQISITCCSEIGKPLSGTAPIAPPTAGNVYRPPLACTFNFPAHGGVHSGHQSRKTHNRGLGCTWIPNWPHSPCLQGGLQGRRSQDKSSKIPT
eukprot:gene10324-biopygen10815